MLIKPSVWIFGGDGWAYEPVLSKKKTQEPVAYVSENGIRGTIKMAEDSDPLT